MIRRGGKLCAVDMLLLVRCTAYPGMAGARPILSIEQLQSFERCNKVVMSESCRGHRGQLRLFQNFSKGNPNWPKGFNSIRSETELCVNRCKLSAFNELHRWQEDSYPQHETPLRLHGKSQAKASPWCFGELSHRDMSWNSSMRRFMSFRMWSSSSQVLSGAAPPLLLPMLIAPLVG